MSERFHLLLKPIKDLADNFNVDLETELEDYAKELESITIEYGIDGINLNFTEAALVLQQSTQVYSKKVEYVYSLLFSVMENVLKKRKARGSDGEEDLFDDDDEPVLMPPNLVTSEATVNMDVMSGSYSTLRRPYLLQHQPLNMLSAAVVSIPSATMLPPGGIKLSTLRTELDGRMIIDCDPIDLGKDDSYSKTRLDIDHDDLDTLPFGSPMRGFNKDHADASNNLQDLHNPEYNSSFKPEGDEYGYDDAGHYQPDFEDGFSIPENASSDGQGDGQDLVRLPQVIAPGSLGEENDEDDSLITADLMVMNNKNPFRKRESRDSSGASGANVDILRKHSTFDKSQRVSKPIARYKPIDNPAYFTHLLIDVTNAPPFNTRGDVLVAESNAASSIGTDNNNVSLPLNQSYARCFLHMLASNDDPFDSKVTGKRKIKTDDSIIKRIKAAEIPEVNEGEGDLADLGSEGQINTDKKDAHDLVSLMHAVTQEPQDYHDFDDGDDHYSMDHHDLVHDYQALASADAVINDGNASYQDLCKAHLTKYLESASRFKSENKLDKRIRDWEERLGPVLEEQESRGHFDIYSYGTRIINGVRGAPQEDSLENIPDDAPGVDLLATTDSGTSRKVDVDDKVVCSLTDTMRGQPRHEVCRMFLSALQLANSGNIDLYVDTHAEPSLQINKGCVAGEERYSVKVDAKCGDSSAELVPPEVIQLKLLKVSRKRTDDDDIDFQQTTFTNGLSEDVTVSVVKGKGKGRGKKAVAVKGKEKPKTKPSKTKKSKGKRGRDEEDLDFVVSSDDEGVANEEFNDEETDSDSESDVDLGYSDTDSKASKTAKSKKSKKTKTTGKFDPLTDDDDDNLHITSKSGKSTSRRRIMIDADEE